MGETMSEWQTIGKDTMLAEGERMVVDLDGTDVVVFKLDGSFYALEDVCTHDGAEIASGMLEGCDIVCPRHGARFCIKTGAVKSAPAYEAITVFPIQIVNGELQIKDTR